jgi:hypothetical protein
VGVERFELSILAEYAPEAYVYASSTTRPKLSCKNYSPKFIPEISVIINPLFSDPETSSGIFEFLTNVRILFGF